MRAVTCTCEQQTEFLTHFVKIPEKDPISSLLDVLCDPESMDPVLMNVDLDGSVQLRPAKGKRDEKSAAKLTGLAAAAITRRNRLPVMRERSDDSSEEEEEQQQQARRSPLVVEVEQRRAAARAVHPEVVQRRTRTAYRSVIGNRPVSVIIKKPPLPPPAMRTTSAGSQEEPQGLHRATVRRASEEAFDAYAAGTLAIAPSVPLRRTRSDMSAETTIEDRKPSVTSSYPVPHLEAAEVALCAAAPAPPIPALLRPLPLTRSGCSGLTEFLTIE